jgi:hypothetical protein
MNNAKQIKAYALTQPADQTGRTQVEVDTKIGAVTCVLLREAKGSEGKTHVAAWFYINGGSPRSAAKIDALLKVV